MEDDARPRRSVGSRERGERIQLNVGEYLLRCADEPRVEMSEDEVRVLIRDEVYDLVIDEALR